MQTQRGESWRILINLRRRTRQLEVADDIDETALATVMRSVPLGAAVLAGSAVAMLVARLFACLYPRFHSTRHGGLIMSDTHPEMHERWILKTELLWAFGVGVFIAAALSMILFTALTISVNPPSNVERIDPKALHLSGEFAEHNLGTTVGKRRQRHRPRDRDPIHVRAAMHRRAGKPTVTLRFASPDVIHGLLITGTNVNTMVVPGFVAQVHTEFTRTGDLLMPCHEYCGLGHSEMWATVQVVPDDQFKPGPDGRISCAQR